MGYILSRAVIGAAKGRSVDISFKEDKTVLLGPNDCGKSSILESICWAISGSPLYGDKNSIISLGDSAATVTLYLRKMEDGKESILLRSLKKTATGTTGGIRLNHLKATEDEVQSFFKGDSKVLKASMFPQSFLGLSCSEQQKILLASDEEDLEKSLKETEKVISELYSEIEECQYTKFQELIPIFEEFDKEVKKTYLGNITRFLAAKASEAFTGGAVNQQLLNALAQYSVIGSSEDLKMKLKTIEDAIENCQASIEANSKRREYLVNKINSTLIAYQRKLNFHGINMTLEEKNSLLKNTGISYKGLPLAACSGKERIEAAIKISTAISETCAINIPIFVDNCESIVSDAELSCLIPSERQAILIYAADTEELCVDNDDGYTATSIKTNTIVPRSPLHKVRTVAFA